MKHKNKIFAGIATILILYLTISTLYWYGKYYELDRNNKFLMQIVKIEREQNDENFRMLDENFKTLSEYIYKIQNLEISVKNGSEIINHLTKKNKELNDVEKEEKLKLELKECADKVKKLESERLFY